MLLAIDSVVGRPTDRQMPIGVYWGYVSTMEGLTGRMTSEIRKPLTGIATGGLATLFQKLRPLFNSIHSPMCRHREGGAAA